MAVEAGLPVHATVGAVFPAGGTRTVSGARSTDSASEELATRTLTRTVAVPKPEVKVTVGEAAVVELRVAGTPVTLQRYARGVPPLVDAESDLAWPIAASAGPEMTPGVREGTRSTAPTSHPLAGRETPR